ncbi:MAG: hypothetical protein ACWA49_10630, partial [Ruegeria sp.]
RKINHLPAKFDVKVIQGRALRCGHVSVLSSSACDAMGRIGTKPDENTMPWWAFRIESAACWLENTQCLATGKPWLTVLWSILTRWCT